MTHIVSHLCVDKVVHGEQVQVRSFSVADPGHLITSNVRYQTKPLWGNDAIHYEKKIWPKHLARWMFRIWGAPFDQGRRWQSLRPPPIAPLQKINHNMISDDFALDLQITRHGRSGDNKSLHGMKRSSGPGVGSSWHHVSSLSTHGAWPTITKPSGLANSKYSSSAAAVTIIRPLDSLQ